MAKTLLAAAMVLGLSVFLVTSLGRLGVVVAVVLVVAGGALLIRRDSGRETAALRRSIDHSASDIATILDDWDDFRYSAATAHVRDREVYRPELLDPASEITSVARFHVAADACDRFLRHLPERTTELTTVNALTELLHETDHRAVSLSRLWERARQESVHSRRS